MNIKFKKLKSKKGEFVDFAAVVLFIFLCAYALISSSFNDIGAINTRLEADRIARYYMLKIESHGYLNLDDSEKLEQKLESIGLSNIDLSGTTMTEVNNGDDVYLDIHYDQTVRELSNFKFEKQVCHEEIPLSSTAKN